MRRKFVVMFMIIAFGLGVFNEQLAGNFFLLSNLISNKYKLYCVRKQRKEQVDYIWKSARLGVDLSEAFYERARRLQDKEWELERKIKYWRNNNKK